MARLDLYRIPGVEGYLLEVQAAIMDSFATTVVVPLVPLEHGPPPITRLNPVFAIEGRRYLMLTQSLSAVTRKELAAKTGALPGACHDDVTDALDMLLCGY